MHTADLLPPEPSPSLSSPSDVPGDGVRDFFFRVASLTFEAIVLSELETSGSKHVSDIISEEVLRRRGKLDCLHVNVRLKKDDFYKEKYPSRLKVF